LDRYKQLSAQRDSRKISVLPQTRTVPTIRDVAELAGVSKSLVSLVLNNSPSVRDAKRQAVLEAMRTLGYRPNAAARSLTERRSRTVGVLLNDLRNPWFVTILEGLNAELHDHDMTMLLGDARLDRRTDERLLRTFMEMRVDGLVLVGSMPASSDVVEAAHRIPTVVAGARDFEIHHVDVIAQDDVEGARLATQHLVGLGHRRVACVTGSYEAAMQHRRHGYERAMTDSGLTDCIHHVHTEMTEDGGHRAALELLGGDARPTALFVAADVAALGSLRAAAELGLRVPQDLSIVGFDNTHVGSLPGTALTSIDVESEWIGRSAARMLLSRLNSPGRRRRTELSTPSLVVRGTTAPR
jgi:DNA-binding LacI/PurR family transcriptional regulator